MAYVDGYILPVPKKNLKAYTAMARKAGKVWKEYGAISYVESVGDDVAIKNFAPFGQTVRLKAGEVVLFSFVTFKSRAHRDRVNAKVMKDPRIQAMCPSQTEMPFDVKRMMYGGFKSVVKL